MGVWKPVDKTEFGLKECAKCEYNVRCQECIYNKKDISRLVAETRADTVLKYSEKVYQLILGFVGEKLSEQDKDYITVRLGQIAKEMEEGE